MAANKKAAFVIHPFKNPPQRDPEIVERNWELLRKSISEIFNKNAGSLSFEELYRTGYNMVLYRHGEVLYNNVVGVLGKRTEDLRDLVVATNDEVFLQTLRTVWDDHKTAMLMVRDILMYMDRTYVVQHKKMQIYDQGIRLFRDNVVHLPQLKERMLQLLLGHITRERNGEAITRDILKSTTQMLVDLGKDVYNNDFEVPFLAKTQEFYQIESQQFITSNSCSDYMKKVEKRLKEETERVSLYLDKETEKGLRKVVETELIQKHLSTLVHMEHSGLVAMLEADKIDDLRRMHDLFSRVAGGLDLVRENLCLHVREIGKALVSDEATNADNIKYVHALLDLKDKYSKIIEKSFDGNKDFQNGLNKAFEYFINLNQRSPEYLSLFMDHNLKSGSRGGGKGGVEDLIDNTLERVMMLFRYLTEKDMFEKYYKQHLAKRLLSDRSASEDAERRVIVMLKSECGYQFTSKLEGMFNDIRMSAHQMDAFREHTRANPTETDITVKVLATGCWPTTAQGKCNPPREIESCCEAFKNFYLRQHNGRVLSWQMNMGNADLKAVFPKSKHEINVPTYHMILLVLFNQQNTLSFAELAEASGISTPELKRALQSLANGKFKILVKEPKSREVNEADTFTFNSEFKYKMVRFKVQSVKSGRETADEQHKTQEKVEEDRKPQIDASIVRVMKARKTMEHNNLVAEVLRQLQSRFSPNPATIKKRVESLIEREYLERVPGDMKTYQYLA